MLLRRARNARPRPPGIPLTVTFNLDPCKNVGAVDGPCPAWPWWQERVEEVRRQLPALAAPRAKPTAAVPKPIAVIGPGLDRAVIRLVLTLDHRELAAMVRDTTPARPRPGNRAQTTKAGAVC